MTPQPWADPALTSADACRCTPSPTTTGSRSTADGGSSCCTARTRRPARRGARPTSPAAGPCRTPGTGRSTRTSRCRSPIARPRSPEENPTGVYERSFEVPAGWAGKRVVLHVGAAESVLLVEVNGQDVGISKDSHLAAEFEVTDLLRPGENELRLTVVKWSDASFVEDQDQWWHGGITRPVFLYATGSTYLADLVVDAGLTADGTTGTLSLEVGARLGRHPSGPGLAGRGRGRGLDGRAMAGDVRHAPPPPGTPADWSVPGRRGGASSTSRASTPPAR